jgi:hypothetical protein
MNLEFNKLLVVLFLRGDLLDFPSVFVVLLVALRLRLFGLDVNCSWRSASLNANQRVTAMADRNFLPSGEIHNLSVVPTHLPLLRTVVVNCHSAGKFDCCVISILGVLDDFLALDVLGFFGLACFTAGFAAGLSVVVVGAAGAAGEGEGEEEDEEEEADGDSFVKSMVEEAFFATFLTLAVFFGEVAFLAASDAAGSTLSASDAVFVMSGTSVTAPEGDLPLSAGLAATTGVATGSVDFLDALGLPKKLINFS